MNVDILIPRASHGLTVGFPRHSQFKWGHDTSRMVCAESDVWAYRDGKWGDYVVADSHMRIHDMAGPGGCYGLFTFDRELIAIHHGTAGDLDAFAHAVQLMRDRSAEGK